MWDCSRYDVSSVMFTAENNYAVLAFGMKTVTLEVVQPSTGPACPGQDVILTCTVALASTSGVHLLFDMDTFSSRN